MVEVTFARIYCLQSPGAHGDYYPLLQSLDLTDDGTDSEGSHKP